MKTLRRKRTSIDHVLHRCVAGELCTENRSGRVSCGLVCPGAPVGAARSLTAISLSAMCVRKGPASE